MCFRLSAFPDEREAAIYRLYDEELKVRSVERKKIGRRQRVGDLPSCSVTARNGYRDSVLPAWL
jgi:hypothetical protein